MRHFRMLRLSFGRMIRMFVCVAACAVSSCVDDTFDKHGQQGSSGMLAFDVAVPGSWTNGSAATCAANKDISIREMSQSGGGKPLYLVTESAESAVDTVASDAITRGTPIEDEEVFAKNSFGLSAICYTGEWPQEDKNEWTTNFAHNIEVSYVKDRSTWNPANALQWVGSGKIRFFAYSPYSAVSASSEDDTAENLSIIHSATDATGVPMLTYTVPKEVTEQIDLMAATADCNGNGVGGDAQNGAVALNFTHALTAVTIKTGKEMLAGTVTDITISGVYGSGTYRIGADNWTTKGGPDCIFSIKQEVALGENTENNQSEIMTKPGTVLNEDEKGYTFMMIPQTLPKGAELKIAFKDNLTGTERTLTAKLQDETNSRTWPVGKRVIYSINSTGIVIEPVITLDINRENTLLPNGGQKAVPIPGKRLYTEMTEEEIAAYTLSYLPVSGLLRDVTIKAYANVTQKDHDTKQVSLPFKIKYSDDINKDKKDWETIYDSSSNESGSSATSKANSRLLKATDKEESIITYQGSIKLPAQLAFDKLREKFISTSTTYADEEVIDLVDKSTTGVSESANCYIINEPGYYKFPTYYGNTYGYQGDDLTTTYQYNGKINDEEIENNAIKRCVLKTFVKHDDSALPTDGKIQAIKDAVVIWQDSPDLVVDVAYNETDEWVYFRVLEETLNQGNALIAVRDNNGVILWSWHIWATHYDWTKGITSAINNEYNKPFVFSPCNLGYCDSQDGAEERNVYICFTVTKPDGTEEVLTSFKEGTFGGVPKPENGIFTLTQPKMIESVAGDNTYYQWGRKDPMLPGVYNSKTIKNEGVDFIAGKEEELDMVNKTFYSIPEYRFASTDCGQSIGASIKNPNLFFIHPNPYSNTDPGYDDHNYLRRHWHNGERVAYQKKTIMNFWNSQLDVDGLVAVVGAPNNRYVYKTIYDPSPAGYKVPPPAAFSAFSEVVKDAYQEPGELYYYEAKTFNGIHVGWTLKDSKGTDFYFPATGLRDMGLPERKVDYGTWPAHSKLTFIATSGFRGTYGSSSSCLLFSIDVRESFKNTPFRTIYGTNNSYGFTLRPIRDGQKDKNSNLKSLQ
ncbi:fimbrillin family protein [uncultured Bacteroides sp.]|uniref:fimbrillin family protein n=1 Tax=uncultured Bacteroides sp. TaxID=162156 RepID=UPI0025DE0719|nr:fimbrillin family protein [uncultured Bacteroides sp.]